MKLLMTTSLGTLDAKRLDTGPAREGETIEVEGEAAEELLKRRWAVAAPAVAPKVPVDPKKAGQPQ